MQHYVNSYYLDRVYTALTSPQVEILFTTISRAAKLEQLHLPGINLSCLTPPFLAQTVSSLEKINISNCQLTSEQVHCLISSLILSTKLKDLDISQTNLSTVDPSILARAVREREIINLENTALSTLQLETMLEKINHESKLTRLNLEKINLSAINCVVLAKAVLRLDVVNLRKTNISLEHVSSIFLLVVEDRRNTVRKLYLDIDLAMQVDPQVIEHPAFIFNPAIIWTYA